MTRDELLAKETFSQEGWNTRRRVWETLMQAPSQAPTRTARLLGLLMERLEEKELLDASEIDDMLFALMA